MNNQYFEMFADDKTNQQRAAQFDALIEDVSPEARARLLTAVDTLKGAGVTELAAKVTLVMTLRHLTMTDEQRLGARNIGIQVYQEGHDPKPLRSTGQVYKFMGEEL
jgi:hypothetical protein